MNIFVARLNYDTVEDTLRDAFEQFGEVSTVKIVFDRETQRSKGFGFVEMPDDTDGQTAIDNLNETDLDGRTIVVKKARPKEATGGFNGGGGFGGRRPRY